MDEQIIKYHEPLEIHWIGEYGEQKKCSQSQF